MAIQGHEATYTVVEDAEAVMRGLVDLSHARQTVEIRMALPATGKAMVAV